MPLKATPTTFKARAWVQGIDRNLPIHHTPSFVKKGGLKIPNHFHSSNTQIYWAVKALLDGRTLTHKTEFREVNGWRLAAIVCELKLKYHWPILAQYRGPENIAHYKLNPSCNPAGLKYPRSARVLKPSSGGQP